MAATHADRPYAGEALDRDDAGTDPVVRFSPSGDRIDDICKIVQQKAVQRIVFRLGFVGLDWL